MSGKIITRMLERQRQARGRLIENLRNQSQEQYWRHEMQRIRDEAAQRQTAAILRMVNLGAGAPIAWMPELNAGSPPAPKKSWWRAWE